MGDVEDAAEKVELLGRTRSEVLAQLDERRRAVAEVADDVVRTWVEAYLRFGVALAAAEAREVPTEQLRDLRARADAIADRAADSVAAFLADDGLWAHTEGASPQQRDHWYAPGRGSIPTVLGGTFDESIEIAGRALSEAGLPDPRNRGTTLPSIELPEWPASDGRLADAAQEYCESVELLGRVEQALEAARGELAAMQAGDLWDQLDG